MTEFPPSLASEQPNERAPRPGIVTILIAIGATLLFAILPWSAVFRDQVIDATRSFPREWRFHRGLRTSGEKLEAFHGFNYRASVFVRGRAGTHVVLLPPKSYLERFYDPDEIEWADARYAVYMAGWFDPVTVAALHDTGGSEGSGSEPTAAARTPDAVRRAVVVDMVDGRPALAVVEVTDPSDLAEVRSRYRSQGWDR